MQRPERILGLRFLSPVLFIPLVELSHVDSLTQAAEMERVKDMMQTAGKLCFEAMLASGANLEGARSSYRDRLRLNDEQVSA